MAQREFYFNFLNVEGVATCRPAFSQKSVLADFETFDRSSTCTCFLHIFVKNCSWIVGPTQGRTDEHIHQQHDCDQKQEFAPSTLNSKKWSSLEPFFKTFNHDYSIQRYCF